MYGLKAAPFREASFSAACKGVKGADHNGAAKSRALEFLHFRAANWPTEDIFPYSDQRTA